MSLPRPNEPYKFQANIIWWDSPFKTLFLLSTILFSDKSNFKFKYLREFELKFVNIFDGLSGPYRWSCFKQKGDK